MDALYLLLDLLGQTQGSPLMDHIANLGSTYHDADEERTQSSVPLISCRPLLRYLLSTSQVAGHLDGSPHQITNANRGVYVSPSARLLELHDKTIRQIR
jgi:hypothetical protein